MERVPTDTSLGKLLEWSARQNTSDFHAQANRRYSYRVDGKLRRIPPELFRPPSNDEINLMLKQAFSDSIYESIQKRHEMDLSFLCGQVRYRANFNKQQGMQSF